MPKPLKIIFILVIAVLIVLFGGNIIFKLAAAAGAVLLVSFIISRGYFWKVYFALILILTIAGLFVERDMESDILYYTGVILTPPALLGLYGFTFNKEIFNKAFWKIFFFIEAVYTIVYLLFGEKYTSSDTSELDIYIIPFTILLWGLFSYPFFYALYKYAFGQEEIREFNNKLYL